MIYMRGNAKDYDNWAFQGNQGWAFQNVLEYFVKLEDVKEPKLAKEDHHGINGPVTVEKARHKTWLLEAFLKVI